LILDWDAADTGQIIRHGVTRVSSARKPIGMGRWWSSSKTKTRAAKTVPGGDPVRPVVDVVIERGCKIRFVAAYPIHAKQREIYRREKE
jgi:hypothetical protein